MCRSHLTIAILAAESDLTIPLPMTGSAIVVDDARGAYATRPEKIFDDLDIERAKAIPVAALHHNVDLLILDADTAGYMRGYLVNPSTIYGASTNELATAGLTDTHSNQTPVLIQASLARKEAGVVGTGKAIWPTIHVDDSESRFSHSVVITQPIIYLLFSAAELFITLFNTIRTNPDAAEATTTSRTARKGRWPGSRRARSCLQCGADDVRAGGAAQTLPEPRVRVRVGLELPDSGESCACTWVEAEVHNRGHVEERRGGVRDVPQEVKSRERGVASICALVLHQGGLGGDVVSCNTYLRHRTSFLDSFDDVHLPRTGPEPMCVRVQLVSFIFGDRLFHATHAHVHVEDGSNILSASLRSAI